MAVVGRIVIVVEVVAEAGAMVLAGMGIADLDRTAGTVAAGEVGMAVGMAVVGIGVAVGTAVVVDMVADNPVGRAELAVAVGTRCYIGRMLALGPSSRGLCYPSCVVMVMKEDVEVVRR